MHIGIMLLRLKTQQVKVQWIRNDFLKKTLVVQPFAKLSAEVSHQTEDWKMIILKQSFLQWQQGIQHLL